MSEAERKKRLNYKERRKKWIFIQGVTLVLVALLIFASVIVYNQLNKEIYIEYKESSQANYKVKIPKDAPFYSDYLTDFEQYADENGDLWIPSNFAYPTMAATVIKIDLDYHLNMGTPNVDYEYTYRIYAHPEVVDSATKNKFPMPKTMLEEITSPIKQSSNNTLKISKSIEINYHDYNNLVKDFEDKLGIRNATENLTIAMEVEVIGSSEVFESNAQNTHVIGVSVPLNENAFDINYSSSVQDGDSKILARKNSGNQHIYRGASIVFGGLELALLITFIAYVYLTRNHDVNYSIKVQRLFSNYRSFIQQLKNGFDTSGYQILEICTFKEMLAIRDTIQSPILMSENTDQTRTQFFIPTNTRILYVFEVKIDNYDELYGAHPEWIDDSVIKLTPSTDKNTEANNDVDSAKYVPAVDNQVISDLYKEIEKLREELIAAKEQAHAPEANDEKTAEVIAEISEELPVAEIDSSPASAETGNTESEPRLMLEVNTEDAASNNVLHEEQKHIDLEHVLNDLEYDEEHGCFLDEDGNTFKIQCRRSFTANIIQSDPLTVKYYYSELKNYALSFKGVKARMSWRYESFKRGRDQLLRMKIRGKSICLYCALDPKQFDKTKYFQEAIDAKMFECVPMLVKVKSTRGLKRAIELIDATMAKFGIEPDPKAKKIDYIAELPFEKTVSLVEKGLIKILDSEYLIIEPKEHALSESAVLPTVTEEFKSIIDMAEQNLEASDALTEITEEPVLSSENIPLADIEFDEKGEIVIPESKKLDIHCKRSFTANLMQSDPATVKTYYSELKNYILSFKGVKSKAAWRYESYKKGRNQLFRIRIKGKGLCLYCALDPKSIDETRYFHDITTSKDYADVPTMVRIKTIRGLKRAKELVDMVMSKFEIYQNPKAKTLDYLEIYPFKKTVELVEAGYIKILSDSYKIKEPKAPKVKKQAAKK